jgi:hypothetical protein
MIDNGEYGAWKIRHPFQYTTEAHNQKYTANLTSVKCQTNVGRNLCIAAVVVSAKCKKIPPHPEHDVPKKANDEPALLPLPYYQIQRRGKLCG